MCVTSFVAIEGEEGRQKDSTQGPGNEERCSNVATTLLVPRTLIPPYDFLGFYDLVSPRHPQLISHARTYWLVAFLL